MARKTKETLRKEALSAISGCPCDLYDLLDDSAELTNSILLCESGSREAIISLSERLLKLALGRSERFECVLYLCALGCRQGVRELAAPLICYAVEKEFGFEYLDSLQGLELTDDEEKKLKLARVKHIISLAKRGFDGDELLSRLGDLGGELSAEKLYLLSIIRQRSEEWESSLSQSLADSEGIPRLTTLPSFAGLFTEAADSPTEEEMAKELLRVKAILYRHGFGGWRDFWLRCLYEYVGMYCRSDYTLIAKDAADVSYNRLAVKRRRLHAFAWMKYYLSHLPEGQSDVACAKRLEALRKECTFHFQSTDLTSAEGLRILRESVYASSDDALRLSRIEEELGAPIIHDKNRYVLRADLSCHSKRGVNHFWNLTAHLPEGKGSGAPTFTAFTIEECNNKIRRGGVTIDNDRACSQGIFRGEMTIGDKTHPMILDLICDIAYISLVKCDTAILTVKKSYVKSGRLILQMNISIN